MDAYRFEVIRTLSVADVQEYLKEDEHNPNIHALEMNARTQEWMEKNNIGREFIFKTKELDWETWFEKNPQYKNYQFLKWDFSDETENKWVQLESPDGTTVLIDNDFIYKDAEYLYVEAKEIGYMRKPFRHSETPNRVEGDTLVLTVTNFSDNGEQGYQELKNIDKKQTDDANVFIFNIEQLDKLKNYSFSPQMFKKNFIQDWNQNHFVQFNW